VGVLLRLRQVDVSPVKLEHRVRRQTFDRLLVVRNDRPVLRGLEPVVLTSGSGYNGVVQIGRIRANDVVVGALK
jgi:hypothetical protein